MKYQNFPNGYKISLTRERNNRDTFKNEYGENLTDLCSTINLRILNGRTLVDLYGEFTYCGINGLSTVDYTLASENVIKDNQIQYMCVQAITFLSDHRPLLLKLSHHSTHATPKEGAIPLQKENLTEIKTSDQSEQSRNNIVNKIENIFIKTATTYKTKGRGNTKRKTTTKKINKHKPWYNKDKQTQTMV